MNGHLPVVRLLIDAKAKIDAVNNNKCEFFVFNNIESNENLGIFVLTDTQRFIGPRVRATRKLFTGLLKWDIMCLFDFFIVRDILIWNNLQYLYYVSKNGASIHVENKHGYVLL